MNCNGGGFNWRGKQMNMIEVKTADLIGPALDWAVAKAEKGYEIDMSFIHVDEGSAPFYCFSPSNRWDQGGPLIEKYIARLDQVRDTRPEKFIASTCGWPIGEQRGETILIAACRAIVAAKLGDVVSVPAELVQGSEQ
jgi:hypothetical protein